MTNVGKPTLDPRGGVFLQAYVESFVGDLLGLKRHIGYLSWMGISGLITQPVAQYEGSDGPYNSIVDQHTMPDVDERFGGTDALREVNWALIDAGIMPVGDLATCNFAERSPLWREALAGDPEAQSWIRMVDDPRAAGFEQVYNVFGLEPYRYVPELRKWVITRFNPDQIGYDLAAPAVKRYQMSLAERLVGNWNYKGGIRYDAIVYAGGTSVVNPDGLHEPIALRHAADLTQVVLRHPGAIALGEIGGDRVSIAPWLRGGTCTHAYDFGWAPAVLASLGRGDWGPLKMYLGSDPAIDAGAGWALFMRHHDELQLRYSEFAEELVARHGGHDRRYVVFDGHGINQRLAALMPHAPGTDKPDERALVMTLALTILMDGMPVVFPGDAEGRIGLVDAPERGPARDPMSWDYEPPLFGWSAAPRQPFAPDAAEKAVSRQFQDRSSTAHQVRRFIALRNTRFEYRIGRRIDLQTGNGAVMAFARTFAGRDGIVLVNARGKRTSTTADLRRWRGKRIGSLVTDGRRYRSSDPDLLWEERPWLGWDDAGEARIDLEPYEVQVLVPF
jgi:maltose alpha-D-glucosyltransferase / alpha-amylase